MLAALSFAYGGFFLPTVNGMSTNGAMWLPLMLVAIEHSRSKSLVRSLALTTFAFSMAVLNGVGQMFLYMGILALAYSITVSFLPYNQSGKSKRFRPIIVATGAILLATGLTAFQTFETWQAVSLSIRKSLDYQTFIEGSFDLRSAWKSFIAPRFNMVDVTTYVPLLGVLLIPFAFTHSRRDVRVWFWTLIAAAAAVLMLGGNSPIYPLIYKIPLLNLFRIPARHSFEWTFALSVLAAYGWDGAATLWTNHVTYSKYKTFLIIFLLLSAIAIGVYWLQVGSETSYVALKLGFALVLLISLWQTFKLSSATLRTVLAACVVVVASFFEAQILFKHLWLPNARSVYQKEFVTPAPATKFLQQFPALDGRVYTDGPHVTETFDGFNLVPYFGLSNVAGYEPAMLLRFSRAMGNIGLDTSQLRHGYSSDGNIFESSSHVLDILNTKYTTAFWDLGESLDPAVDRNNVRFAATAGPIRLKPREKASFTVGSAQTDYLAVVSSLGYATNTPQGEIIGRIKFRTSNGGTVDRELRAGIDTAEWAYERPDIRHNIPHQLPTIFDSFGGDDQKSFEAHRYLSNIGIGDRQAISQIEIENVSGVYLLLWKLTVIDSATRISTPLDLMGPERWETVFNKNRVVVLKNKRALPRTWLVSNVKSVSAEEALQAIRGQSNFEFDPATTALVETPAGELPQLKGETLANSSAQVVAYGPNHLTIDATTEDGAMLVVSEINYPGWVAVVDGQSELIHQTDYLLRGVFLRPGKHHIEMRYTAPRARQGLFISGLSLVILCGIVVASRRLKKTS